MITGTHAADTGTLPQTLSTHGRRQSLLLLEQLLLLLLLLLLKLLILIDQFHGHLWIRLGQLWQNGQDFIGLLLLLGMLLL